MFVYGFREKTYKIRFEMLACFRRVLGPCGSFPKITSRQRSQPVPSEFKSASKIAGDDPAHHGRDAAPSNGKRSRQPDDR